VPFIVTGISQDGQTAAIEASLQAAGLDLDGLEVLGPDDINAPVNSGHLDTAIITGGGLETGTGVPGLTNTAPRLSDISHAVSGDSLWDRLADLAIPDDEVENYAEALEAGRSIVAYHGSPANAAAVEALFARAGLAKVKTF
jgi:hypothetical protein